MNISEQELIGRLKRLPRRVEPPEDLWPGINRQLAARRSGGWHWQSVAAGMIAVIGTIFALWLGSGLETDELVDGPEASPPYPGGGLVYARSVDRQYRGALDIVAGEMPRRPASVAEFGELQLELRTLERAAEEIRAAIEQDPDAMYLAQLLETTHRKRIRMLRALALVEASLEGPRRT